MLDIVRGFGDLGAWGPAGLVALFIVGTLAFVPRNIMCLASGLVLGLWAIPVALAGATIGSVAAFLTARYLLQGWFDAWVRSRPSVAAAVRAVEQEGWLLMVLLRLGAPVPSSAMSYAFGLSRVRLWQFALATLIGVAPQTILVVNLGAAGQIALDTGSPVQMALSAAGIAAFAAATWLITRRAKALLRAQATSA